MPENRDPFAGKTGAALDEAVATKIAALKLPAGFADTVRTTYPEIARALVARKTKSRRPPVVGICGSQGSGKSTLAAFLKLLLDWEGKPSGILSLDDFYMTKAQREKLARRVHPMLATRGVPGTHDVTLGLKTLERLQGAGVRSLTPLPAFEKAKDDRKPAKQWQKFKGRPAFILFEGWCVDARPQNPGALLRPINRLERDCDPDGIWRTYVNDQLAGPYRELFAPIDILLFLAAPSFDCVYKWRGLQEKKLARTRRGNAVMNSKELENFIMHYERLTRWMLKEMPARADILLPLSTGQHIRAVEIRSSSGQPRKLTMQDVS